MLHRLTVIGRELLPTADLVCKSVLRAGIGLAIIYGSSYVAEPVAGWLSFGGKFFVMIAAIGLFGHIEGTIAKHVSAKLRIEGTRAWTACSRGFTHFADCRKGSANPATAGNAVAQRAPTAKASSCR